MNFREGIYAVAAMNGKNFPAVGISINVDGDRQGGQNIYTSYVDAIYNVCCSPFVIPLPDIALEDSYALLAELAMAKLDGLLLTGGDDVDARRYGDVNLPFNGAFSEERDLFEIELCRRAALSKKPILAICRGIQVLNVAMGGTLFQDIIKQNPEKTVLMHAQRAPSYSCVHDVLFAADSALGRAMSAPGERHDGDDGAELRESVNSFHHQAVRDVAPGFAASARSPDGIIEAIEPEDGGGGAAHPFTIGVQWHPERMWRRHKSAEMLFSAFASACKTAAFRPKPRKEGLGR
jgi:putative glutamine amidotransferase